MEGKSVELRPKSSDLIDFDSLSPKGSFSLIPGPKSSEPFISNPFDLIANEAEIVTNDPFEMVFKSACFPLQKNNEYSNVIKSVKTEIVKNKMDPDLKLSNLKKSSQQSSKEDCGLKNSSTVSSSASLNGKNDFYDPFEMAHLSAHCSKTKNIDILKDVKKDSVTGKSDIIKNNDKNHNVKYAGTDSDFEKEKNGSNNSFEMKHQQSASCSQQKCTAVLKDEGSVSAKTKDKEINIEPGDSYGTLIQPFETKDSVLKNSQADCDTNIVEDDLYKRVLNASLKLKDNLKSFQQISSQEDSQITSQQNRKSFLFSDIKNKQVKKHVRSDSLPTFFPNDSSDKNKSSSVSSIDMSKESISGYVRRKLNKIKASTHKTRSIALSQSSEDSNDFNKGFLFTCSSFKSSVPDSSKLSKQEDANLDFSIDSLEDDVFIEAKKLADTFSKMSTTTDKVNNEESETEDLMSINPKWVAADSSEEEIENLRNDPSLNWRFSSSSISENCPRLNTSEDFIDVVKEYSKRRSIDLNSSFDVNTSKPDMSHLKRSHSFSGTEHSKEDKVKETITKPLPLINPDILISKKPEAIPLDNEEFTQKLKVKKPTNSITKKGPLKAVIPLQKMTRTDVVKGLKKMCSPKKRKSSLPKAPLSNGFSSPQKLRLNAHPIPVASSTPNKKLNIVGSPSPSPIMKSKTSDRLHRSMDSNEKLQQTSFHDDSKVYKKSYNQKKINSSDSDLKKVANEKHSLLPRSKSVLNTHSSNKKSQPNMTTAPLIKGGLLNKMPSKMNFTRRKINSNDKENVFT